MWILVVLLLQAFPFLLWGCITFSLIKQYRYATIFTDMLRYYLPLSVIALSIYIIAVILVAFWLQIPVWLWFILPGIVIPVPLVYYSNRWANCYQMHRYVSFLEELKKPKYVVKLFKEYQQGNLELDKVNVFIRHDIDISLSRLKHMVKIEEDFHIRSTCFFRLHAERYSFKEAIPIIEQLNNDGFEIGFHHETLRQTKGDLTRAIPLFKEDLENLREIVPVSVVAAHGGRYHNRKIWSEIDSDALQVWSAYEMKFNSYISDAGGKDMIRVNKRHAFEGLKEAKPGDVVQVLVHPDWWY